MGNFSNYWDLHTLFTKIKNKIKSVSDKIDDSVSLKTATGNPITLTDAANANAEELLMTIEPVQSGSGDPSPTNVRPISGLTEGVIQTTNGTDTNTATISFGQTVYGGSVNFKTGEVTVTHGYSKIKDLTWLNGSKGKFYCAPSNCKGDTNIISSAYPYCGSQAVSGNPSTDKAIGHWGAQLVVMDTSYNNATNFVAAMGEEEVCYELATPTTLTLTPAELELLKGNNTITANGAEISIEYYPDNAIGVLAGRVDDKADKEDVAIPKYDAANRREYFEGGAAFDGNIDSVPTAGSNNAVSSGGTKTYVDNAVDAIKYLTTSTTSFTDAGTKAGIQYGAEYADIIHYRIADLSTGIFMLETSGPKLGVVLFKYTNNYYSGIILNYFAMNERKPIYFVYQTGTYGIRTL